MKDDLSVPLRDLTDEDIRRAIERGRALRSEYIAARLRQFFRRLQGKAAPQPKLPAQAG